MINPLYYYLQLTKKPGNWVKMLKHIDFKSIVIYNFTSSTMVFLWENFAGIRLWLKSVELSLYSITIIKPQDHLLYCKVSLDCNASMFQWYFFADFTENLLRFHWLDIGIALTEMWLSLNCSRLVLFRSKRPSFIGWKEEYLK